MTRRLLVLVPLVAVLAACGTPKGQGGADGGADGGAGVTLKLAPEGATLTTVDGKAPSQVYTLTA